MSFGGFKLKLVGLAVLAVVTFGLAAFALMRPVSPPPQTAVAVPTISAVPVSDGPSTVAEVAPKLKGSEPFTLAVIGDSTGYGPDGWVWQAVEAITAQTGRRAAVHDWNAKAGAYDAPKVVGPEGKTTLTVWNGSASGRNAQYSLDNLAALLPEKADLIIVNHGHNIVSVAAADKQIRGLLLGIRTSENSDTAVAFTLQNPRIKDKATGDAVRGFIGGYVKSIPEIAVIDAHAAFKGNLPALLNPDGLHPVRAGYTLWANTALSTLGLEPNAS